MAVNYTNLFSMLGELVQRVNQFVGLYATVDTGLSEILADFDTAGRNDLEDGLTGTFDGYKRNLQGWVRGMNTKAEQVLMHRESMLEQLNLLNGPSLANVLTELWRNMVDNTETINRSTVTIGAVTTDCVNVGVGGLITGKMLNGVTSPGAAFGSNWEYNGVDSELSSNDDMVMECTADSENDGATLGQERFSWYGRVPLTQGSFSWENYGSGSGPSMSTIQGDSILLNSGFDDFTADLPDSWTLDAGTVVTNIDDNTDVVLGTTALSLIGNAATASIQISQIDVANTPRNRFVFGFWIKGDAAISAGTLYIGFTGTGYTASSGEKIELNTAALAAATTYTWFSAALNIPDQVPADWKFIIRLNGTPSAHTVKIDAGGLVSPNYFNGIYAVPYAGAGKFMRTDRLLFTVANDEAGIFQKWFRLAFGIQMPSSGTPSRADSLAT